MVAIVNTLTPVMLKWLHEDAPREELGASFAAWVSDGWGIVDLKLLQQAGVEAIVNMYRQSLFWATLAPMEAKFREFVTAFVNWQPSEDDGVMEPEIEDLTEEINVTG